MLQAFVADHAGGAGSFVLKSDTVAGHLPASMVVGRVCYDLTPTQFGRAREALVGTINGRRSIV